MTDTASRSGHMHPLGKLTYEVKVRLPESAAEELENMAHRLGVPVGEVTRDIIIARLFGRETIEKLLRHRLDVVCGTGAETSQQGETGE